MERPLRNPPARTRVASPLRILHTASTTASFPVLQADELDVTWFPKASRPAIRALVAAVHDLFDNPASHAAHLALVDHGNNGLGDGNPCRRSPEPTITPVSQST